MMRSTVFGGVVGVQRAEHEHAHRGAAERELDRFHFAHFAEQENVGVVAHRAFERGGERLRVLADFAVHDDRLLHRVHELDRILDRDDVLGEVRIDVVDHRRERSGLAAAGRAGDDDEALIEMAEFLQRLGQLEIVEGKNLRRNLAEDRRLAPVVVEIVAAETRERRASRARDRDPCGRGNRASASRGRSPSAAPPWSSHRAWCRRSAAASRRCGTWAEARPSGAGRTRPFRAWCGGVSRWRP